MCELEVRSPYLKESYDDISSFLFSLECYKLCIDKIPEAARLKSQNQRD